MKLKKLLRACSSESDWVDSKESYERAWDECERGDWMLWIAQCRDVDIRTLMKVKVECTKLVEHLMTDDRSINALRVAERFSDGDATLEELNAAAAAAYAAADAAYDAAAAAYAAAYAAYAYDADAAAYAAYAADAYAAADAAYAAAYAADAYAAYAAAYAADAAAAYAADAAAAAADAADAAYAADAADAAAAARSGVLKKSADICRKYIKFEDLKMGDL